MGGRGTLRDGAHGLRSLSSSIPPAWTAKAAQPRSTSRVQPRAPSHCCCSSHPRTHSQTHRGEGGRREAAGSEVYMQRGSGLQLGHWLTPSSYPWSPECGAALSPVAEGIKTLVPTRGQAGTVFTTQMDICCALASRFWTRLSRNNTLVLVTSSEFKVRSAALVLRAESCQQPTSYCSYLIKITALRQAVRHTHTPSRSVCL